jgi:hypothetical protein
VIAAKPAAPVDLCYLTGDRNFATPVYDFAVSDQDARLVKRESPRQVAGGLLEENILKCRTAAAEPRRLRGRPFHTSAADAAAGAFCHQRLRLEPAGRRPVGSAGAAALRCRP